MRHGGVVNVAEVAELALVEIAGRVLSETTEVIEEIIGGTVAETAEERKAELESKGVLLMSSNDIPCSLNWPRNDLAVMIDYGPFIDRKGQSLSRNSYSLPLGSRPGSLCVRRYPNPIGV